MITKNLKKSIVTQFGANENDTGSVQVQIAILNAKIRQINGHLADFPKDFHSRHGLLKMVGRRKRYLNYLRDSNAALYNQIVDQLKV